MDVIYQLKKNEEQMQEKIAALEAELQDRRIHLSAAGSIAEAATEITGIFSTALSTADLYLREIALMKEETQKECEKMMEKARHKAESILADGTRQYGALAARYKEDYRKWKQLCAEMENLKESANEE